MMSKGKLILLLALASTPLWHEAQAAQTTLFIYDESGHVLGEYDANGNPVQEHIYVDDRPVAVAVTSSGTTTIDYVTTDQLDTPRDITDGSGAVIWTWNSDPFGNGQPTGSITYNLRFPGQYLDTETGLHYNNARYYSPTIGRYYESDPIGLAGGVNTYAYVRGNPLRWSDRAGLAPGDYPPPPPDYDPSTWTSGQWENGNWYLQDPQGNTYTAHPEDNGHWRHWDKQNPDGKDLGMCPRNSGKPRPGQYRGFKPNQGFVDPNGEIPGWEPPVLPPLTNDGLPTEGEPEPELPTKIPEEPFIPPS